MQTLTWLSEHGKWSAVVMNANSAAGVTVDLRVGAHTGLLLPMGIGALGAGVIILGAGGVALVFAARRRPEGSPAVQTGHRAVAGASPGAYPARLDGQLGPVLSRWLWLVKWVLIVPHLILLAFLWVAAIVLTVVAGFAILFTARYPRSIFTFNVGVMRWSWRVGFYCMNAFATDRYPPFSLEPDPSYPADLDVDYPEHLSRGLVLVKWWLLAIPQYLIVAFFSGGAGSGGSLIFLLSLIAVVILAVTGSYPASIFDFVMGMNRWCLRVAAYALLMRDEYPPFRLDSGGTDPGSQTVAPITTPPPESTGIWPREPVGAGK
jgi:hypothetical protein